MSRTVQTAVVVAAVVLAAILPSSSGAPSSANAAAPPDLTIEKTAAGSFWAGATAYFQFLVRNQSATPETGNVVITDNLPPGWRFSYMASGTPGWDCSGRTTVTCIRAGPWPTSFLHVTIGVVISPSALGAITNSATVSAADEVNTSNNTSSVTVAVQQVGLLIIRSGSGLGTVVANPYGMNCGDNCQGVYVPGTRIQLMATPSSGSTFVGWSGPCTGVGACQFTMGDLPIVVGASFQRTSENPVNVRVVRPAVQPSALPTLQATISPAPSCGTIEQIQFGTTGQSFANASMTITAPVGGPAGQTSSFVYAPPTGTTSVSLTFQRVVQAGGATISPIRVRDSCGEWTTLVGGGASAFR